MFNHEDMISHPCFNSYYLEEYNLLINIKGKSEEKNILRIIINEMDRQHQNSLKLMTNSYDIKELSEKEFIDLLKNNR